MSTGRRFVPHGRTDEHEEAISRFSQFRERVSENGTSEKGTSFEGEEKKEKIFKTISLL